MSNFMGYRETWWKKVIFKNLPKNLGVLFTVYGLNDLKAP